MNMGFAAPGTPMSASHAAKAIPKDEGPVYVCDRKRDQPASTPNLTVMEPCSGRTSIDPDVRALVVLAA